MCFANWKISTKSCICSHASTQLWRITEASFGDSAFVCFEEFSGVLIESKKKKNPKTDPNTYEITSTERGIRIIARHMTPTELSSRLAVDEQLDANALHMLQR
jgi:hypothetical protein